MDIQPVTLWVNGQTVTATKFINTLVYDNLSSEAKFYYQLQDSNDIKLADGNLDMTGADYTNWNGNPDINLAAYNWAASQLNLTIV